MLAITLLASGCGGGAVGNADGTASGNGVGAPDADGNVRAAATCPLSFALTTAPTTGGPDPLLPAQWHLRNTGQSGGTAGEDIRATTTWASTRGSGVRVAVTDDAIDVTHPDLAANLVAGESHNYRVADSAWPVPCDTADDHGTAVAGILLARGDNGIGISGVAPLASLVAFNALGVGDDASIADAMTRGSDAGNQVWHNSWGSPDDGRPNAAPAVWQDAIDQGLALARGGRGAVYVFPGGNGGRIDVIDSLGQVAATISDNSNLDGYANRLGVIATCAVDDRGGAPAFSEAGANLLVCAPGRGSTSDIVTTAPTSPVAPVDRYVTDFAGTSASAPMVAGVASLMLSVAPSLTWRDVRRILARSARQNDPTSASWVTDAQGNRYSHRYGFGVVDAQAAVQLARTWASVGGSAQMRTCGPYDSAPTARIPDSIATGTPGAPITNSQVAAACPITEVEFVEVHVTIDHPYSGDLQIRLISPNGLVSELADARGCGRNVPADADPCRAPFTDWRFGSARHLFEPLGGSTETRPWTLEVRDLAPTDEGTLRSWSLRLYGR